VPFYTKASERLKHNDTGEDNRLVYEILLYTSPVFSVIGHFKETPVIPSRLLKCNGYLLTTITVFTISDKFELLIQTQVVHVYTNNKEKD